MEAHTSIFTSVAITEIVTIWAHHYSVFLSPFYLIQHAAVSLHFMLAILLHVVFPASLFPFVSVADFWPGLCA